MNFLYCYSISILLGVLIFTYIFIVYFMNLKCFEDDRTSLDFTRISKYQDTLFRGLSLFENSYTLRALNVLHIFYLMKIFPHILNRSIKRV